MYLASRRANKKASKSQVFIYGVYLLKNLRDTLLISTLRATILKGTILMVGLSLQNLQAAPIAPSATNAYITNTNNTINSVLNLIDTPPRKNDRIWVKGSFVAGKQGDSDYLLENTSNYSVVQAGVYLLDLDNQEQQRRFLLTLSGGTTLGTLNNTTNNQNFTGYNVALQEQFFVGDYFLSFAEIYLTENYKDTLFTGASTTMNEMLYNGQFGKHFVYKYAVLTPLVFYTLGDSYDDAGKKFKNQEYGFRATLSARAKFAPYIYFEDSEYKQDLYLNTMKNNITTWAAGVNYSGKRVIVNVNYSYETYRDSSYSEGQFYAGIRYNM